MVHIFKKTVLVIAAVGLVTTVHASNEKQSPSMAPASAVGVL
jgi:hypothetical protein